MLDSSNLSEKTVRQIERLGSSLYRDTCACLVNKVLSINLVRDDDFFVLVYRLVDQSES